VSIWMGCGLSAWGMDLRYGETVYLFPTTTTVSVPTTYVATSTVVPSSYLLPTAFVVPSYYPTAYIANDVVLAPTTYVQTQYRQSLIGRLFGRARLVERSVVATYPAYVPTIFTSPVYSPTTYVYSPTTYSVARAYAPTVFDSPVTYETAYLTSPASPCDEVVSSWRVPVREAPSLRAPGLSASQGSKKVESQAADDSTISSNVVPEPGAYTTLPNRGGTEETAKGKSTSEAETPPPPPVAEAPPEKAATNKGAATKGAATKDAVTKDAVTKNKDAGSAKAAPEATPKTQVKPPVLQDDSPIERAPGDTSRREVQKPLYATNTGPRERRNILFGKVESSAGGQPEEEVRVIVSSRSNRAIRHEGMSDAYGRFAIKLSDGDWTVNVTMANGRVFPVSQITVSGGKIYDQREGLEVPSLIITR
jgi:hypothetical protein